MQMTGYDREEFAMQSMPMKPGHDGQDSSDENDGSRRRESPCETIKNFALNVTTAHGFPNIFRAATRVGRLLWTFLFLAGVSVAAYQITMLVLKYLDFPVNVEVVIISKATLEFPSVTVCNTNKLRHSVIDKSRHRQMLLVDQSASLPYYAPCLDDDFHCENINLCIKRYLICDGIRQCGEHNLSDEKNCNYESGTCTSDFFRCSLTGSSMGLCIPKRKKCDRKKDCYGGEDEDGCPCKGSEFQCTRGGCISKRLVCDTKSQCLDGSDETHCDPEYMHRCPSEGRSIPESFVCDNYKDCIDGSDENSCETKLDLVPSVGTPSHQQCGPDELQCGNSGECFNSAFACDGENDCYNGHDESIGVCGREAVCEPPQVRCPVGGGCGVLCDLRDECIQSSDEKNCNCSVFMSNTDETPVEVIKCSGISRVTPVLSTVDSEYWMTCDPSGTGFRIRTSLYECEEGLDCYRPGSSIPQPCKTVYSSCYLSQVGRDYRGVTSYTECLSWSHPNVTSWGYSGFEFWELMGLDENSTVTHNYCRNPGGLRDEPWCFLGERNGDVVHQNCFDDKTPLHSSGSCHNATLNISIALEDDGRSNASQGRLRITTSDGVVGTISDQFWTIDDMNVVCWQLGFPFGALMGDDWALMGDEVDDFGLGTGGPVLITDVQCGGFESSLIDCFYRVATAHDDDDHSHDVGVVCNTTGYVDRSNVTDVDERLRRRRDADSVPEANEMIPLTPNLQLDATTADSRMLESKKRSASNVFSCGDGSTIPFWQTCNKFPDCADGRDEWAKELDCDDIVTECNFHEFQCKGTDSTGGRRCIPKTMVCDGYNDCTDKQLVTKTNIPAWDEQRCPRSDKLSRSTPSGYYRCYGSRGKADHYIHKRDVCNTVKDCVEEEDEMECPKEMPKDKEDPFKDPKWYLPYKRLLKPKEYHLWESFSTNYTKPPYDRVKDSDPPNWNSFMTFSAQPDYSDLVDVLTLSADEITKFGHQQEDFILQCTYEQKKCNMSHIEVIQNDKYGNCFTFNNKNQKMLAAKTGSRNGLQMTLFLEQSEYISIYGQEAGVRVSITPTHISPSPTDIGITIKPGTVTSIGLRYNDVIRKGPPHGKCKETVENTQIIANGNIRETNPSEKYDLGLCKKTCVHQHIMNYCGCSDTLELDGPRCRLLNDTQDLCKNLVYFVYHHDKLKCNCPEQCSDIYYTKTSSMSLWPSRKFAKLLLRNLHSINSKTMLLNEDNIYENIARLEVYYEELNYERTEEKASYQESSLFGDIGGIVGLYIGFSLITVCEFIGLILKLFKNNCLAPATSL